MKPYHTSEKGFPLVGEQSALLSLADRTLCLSTKSVATRKSKVKLTLHSFYSNNFTQPEKVRPISFSLFYSHPLGIFHLLLLMKVSG